MFILLFTILGLMLWSVRLMVSAFRQHDFSLLFAGTLVALSSAGIVTAYSLMNGCMGYLNTQEFFTPPQNIMATTQIQHPSPSSNPNVWLDEIPQRD